MKLSVTADARGGVAKARTFKREMAKGMRINAGLSGKMASWQCSNYTRVAAKKHIDRDIENAYGNRDEPGWEGHAYLLIKQHKGEDAANSFWRSYKSKGQTFDAENPSSLEYEEKFDKMNFPGGRKTTKEAEYLAYRKANDYTLPTGKNPSRKVLGVVRNENLQKFVKKRMDTRGLAKMAWKACFEKLNNGRKANVVSVMGAKERKFDVQYKAAYQKFGKQSLGSAKVNYNKNGFNVKLTNHVRYADVAFHDFARSKVNPLVKRYMKIIFDLRRKNASKAAAAASRRRAEIKMAA